MWLTSLILIILTTLFFYLDTRKPKNFPPGPRWFPIIGSALELNRIGKKTGSLSKTTEDLAKKYGPVIGTRVGVDRIIFIYGYNEYKEFSTREEFNGRPNGIFYTSRTWGKRRGVLFTDCQFWEEQRAFVLRQLKEFGFGRKGMSDMIEQEGYVMIENIRKKVETGGGECVLRMDNLFGVYVLNTLWTMMNATKYNPEDQEVQHLQNLLTDLITKIHMDGALFSHFPILRYICPQYSGYTAFVEIHEKVLRFIREEIEKAKNNYNPSSMGSFVDVYLNMLNVSGKKGSFSEDQLLAVCLDLFIAGTETTTKTLGFAFLYLTLNPEIQKKAQEEIDAVIGRHRLPTMEDRRQLPYVDCVVLESLRMFGGRAFAVPHRTLKDTHLNGYFIPKDAIIMGCLQSVLFDKNSGWENPDVFEPERFVKNGRIEIPENYIPFGLGKHKCLGETLARANVFLFVACLLQHFNFSVVPGDPPVDGFIDGLTPSPKPYVALVTPR